MGKTRNHGVIGRPTKHKAKTGTFTNNRASSSGLIVKTVI